MQPTGHTILVTGGGSGIGRGLAEQFHARGNRVVIAGRRQETLDAVAAAAPGIDTLVLDVADRASIAAAAVSLARTHPDLDVLVNNAGIMREEDMTADPYDLTDAEAIVATNLLGTIRLTAALLPQLKRQPSATIVTVSSGLAFVPMAATPTYCATKAAIHSWSQSLREQFRGTPIEVIEVAPPAVATDLMQGHAASPRSMPLQEYIAETMAQFDAQAPENLVERVKMLRFAEREGRYAEVFGMVNAPR
ncbi:SDR family oxidoreductase [Sphingomonas sp.]|uniref:SDR family oxidoreductase n=1 Tax=Sphingomonas sp. TaxID=28214 RepID=UPI002D808162|nr:SDR family NAD(P)-dependent oxidoreductase [Sphingomonas sp.]HEU0045730.1 SDR family NAD(P)-dependent oxidoreductase [Sphingomonas sp.]